MENMDNLQDVLLKEKEVLKYEIAEELGLADKVKDKGWRSLTAKESGRIGGLMNRRMKRQQGGE